MYFNKAWEKINGVETDYMKLYYYEFAPGYSDVYNTYSYFRLCTILEGRKKVRVDEGKDFVYDNNQYVMLSPRSKVHMSMPENTKALVLELSDTLIEDVSRKISIENNMDTSFDTLNYQVNEVTKDMMDTLGSINNIYNTEGNDKDKIFFMDLAVQKMTYGLLKDNHSRDFLFKQNDSPIKVGLEMLKEGYKSGITISEVAFKLNMSPSSFTNKFKQAYDMTPKQYLNAIKMEKAKQELLTKNVSEVAFDMGYANVSNFIQKFKERFNITPKQYQIEYGVMHGKLLRM